MDKQRHLHLQIQALIANAPQDAPTQSAIKAIAPGLQEIAQGLKHHQYYVLESSDQRWQLTTLSHRRSPARQKTVVYAYGSLQAAAEKVDSPLLAIPHPVVQLLFQMLSLEGVDSLIFLDDHANPNAGREITRQQIQAIVQARLQQLRPTRIPPDWA
jgi:hypothetical protein